MKNRFLPFLAVFCACSLGARASAASTQITVLHSRHTGFVIPDAALVEQLRTFFDSESYREIRAQPIFTSRGKPDHLLVYLFANGLHKVELASVKLDSSFHFLSKTMNYRLEPQDIEQQPGPKAQEAHCPDSTAEFIAFAPNNDSLEQQVTEEVAKAAEAAHLKTVRLTQANATRQNYLDYMVCPALKGNFYDGDANPNVFVTVDGEISSDDVSTVMRGAFRFKVTNIWLACEAYNNPMLGAVQIDAQAQKYAAGINDLEIGPSDHAGACAMEAALQGEPMTQAFEDCYKKLDVSSDQWGFGGSGSDIFGQ